MESKGVHSHGQHGRPQPQFLRRGGDQLRPHERRPRIQARTGFKAYEVQAVIAAIAEVVAEEVLESNRITLADTKGTRMVTLYPKVSGSVSDADILRETTEAHAADPSKAVRSVAEEKDLTPERLSWNIGATVGV